MLTMWIFGRKTWWFFDGAIAIPCSTSHAALTTATLNHEGVGEGGAGLLQVSAAPSPPSSALGVLYIQDHGI